MATLSFGGTALGSPLTDLLLIDELIPGSAISYQMAKLIYVNHPLGPKMAEKPISVAQSQDREISIANDPDDRIADAFNREWQAIGADRHIFNVVRLARIYGVGSVVYGAEGYEPSAAIPPEEFHKLSMYFNILDPLNTAGSLVLSQDPNAPDFQKHGAIAVAGVPYHRSRSCVFLNEEPIYIEYTSSAFGYVGRSVYQRPLYPLKSFIQSMITDDMVTQKAGLLVAKMKQGSSITDRIMMAFAGLKRTMLQGGRTGNVLTISPDEAIETLNMMNLDGAAGFARNNILANIAAAASMPAMMINDETFAEGFGEGTEDAKDVARYINDIRQQMQPLYNFFDFIVQYRAWNEDFYEILKAEYPDRFKGKPYKTAFFEWVNSFTATWPNLLIEPDSERAKSEKVVLDALVEVATLLMPAMDPENKATLVGWVADNLNDKKLLFQSPLILDLDALAAYEPPIAETMGGANDDGKKPAAKKKPSAKADSVGVGTRGQVLALADHTK